MSQAVNWSVIAANNATLLTLKALAQASVPQYLDGTHDMELAAFYNADASPDYYVWRINMTKEQLRKAAVTGSGEIDNLEVGKRDSLLWLIGDALDASIPEVRTGFQDLTANRTGGFIATNLRAAVVAAAKRKASVIEKAMATAVDAGASPTGAVGAPMNLGFEGPISAAMASTIRAAV